MNTRPTTIDDMVGQHDVKTVIKTLVRSSTIEQKPIPHIIWAGPSGTGKTTAAKATANLRKVKLHSINASVISNITELKNVIKKIKRNEILFIDEIHSLKNNMCEFLYTIMEDFEYQEKKQGRIRTVKTPEFTVIGATTELGLLPTPLKMRFKFTANFKEYTNEELIKIVFFVCRSYGFKLSENIAKIIAKTCRNTPRIVVNRTEWVRSYLIANNLKKINSQQVKDVIKMQGVDENGFTQDDVGYLKVLAKEEPVSLSRLSSCLNVSKETIENDIEPYLLRKGFISITTSGRVLKYDN